jgi:hypothetical protein
MFYAIYSPNIPLRYTETPYKFFIDLKKLIKDEIEDSVFSWSSRWREYITYLDENGNLDIQRLLNDNILPLSIFQNKDEYYKIRYGYMKEILNPKDLEKIDEYINNIFDYHVLTLSLDISYNEKPEEIAILFERINKTGIRLSTYDLLTARFYKYIKLREEWEKVFEEKPNIKKLASRVDNTNVPFSFIQALALSYGNSIKSRDLIKIDNSILNKENWNKVVEIVENKVLTTLGQIDEFGIADINKWLPYNPLITLLTAFYLKLGHIDNEKIAAWYWSSVFTERYSGSTEEKMMKDFRDVNIWINDSNFLPEVVEDFLVQLSKDAFTLKNVRRSGSSKYKGVFNLIFKNKAQDFYYPENLAFNKLEDHHIFPKAFLKSKNVEVEYDTVLNRTLIFDETNRKISNKSPSEYIQEMIEIQMKKGLTKNKAEEKIKKILKNHFIDDEMYEILKNTSKNLTSEEIMKNFENFISKREKLIIEKIKELVDYKRLISIINEEPNISERSKLNKQFWKSLLEKSNKKFDLFSTRKPTVENFLEKRVSKGLILAYHLYNNYGGVKLYIDFGKGFKELNEKVFDFLYKHKSEFEKVMGNDLEWERNDKNRSCHIYKKIYKGGTYKIETWDKLQDLMIDNMVKLYNLIQKFIPEIEKIANEYMNK